jgi:anti-sigma-K factor RskA
MNAELTHGQVLELLPAYVIGALEPEEMLAVEAYLDQHRVLLARLREVEQAVAQMPYAAPEAPLPAAAKDRLMARVHSQLAAQPAAKSMLRPVTPMHPLPQQPVPAAGWLTWLRLVLSSWEGLATAGALVVLLIVAFWAAQNQARLNQVAAQLNASQAEITQLQADKSQLQQTNSELQQQLQAATQQLEQNVSQIEALQAKIIQLQTAGIQLQQANATLQEQWQTGQELLALIASTDPQRVVQLPGTTESPDATGAFFPSDAGRGVLVLQDLEPLPTTQTYQLWFIPADGPPAPAGLLAVQAGGPTWLTVDVPPVARNFAAVGVSVEPAGGSPAPTKVVLLGTTS